VRIAALALAAGLLLGVAACGGGSSAGQPAGSIKVSLTEYKFDPSTLSEKSGTLVFFLVNDGTVSHDLVIRDSSGTRMGGSDLISAGDTFVFTINNLAAGTYTYFCDQPGHEQSGMKGTLTVT
jgi:plastocyanin